MGNGGVIRNDPVFLEFKVPSGQTKSNSLQAPGRTGAKIENPRMALAAVVTPAAFDGTSVGFEVSLDGITWYPVHNPDGSAYGLTVGVNRWTCIPPAMSYAWQFIRLVGTSQTADRSVMGVFMVV